MTVGGGDESRLFLTDKREGDNDSGEVRGDSEREWPYDPETATVDLRHMRSTDLPFNSFVHMPPALEEEEEIKIQNMKRDLIKVTKQYVNEEKGKREKHAQRYVNLTEEENRGLERIRERKDVVIFQTDKSGRLAVETKDSYLKSAQTHVEGDRVINDKDHDTLQKEANAHTTMWLRFTRAGEETGSGPKGSFNRIKNSMKVSNYGCAPLYALRKDHKEDVDQIEGPPTRPVCGGNEAYNHKLSHLLGLFLRPVWQNSKTTYQSTEEMLAAIEDVNKRGELDDRCTFGCLDVKALYPSLDVEFTSETVGNEFFMSDIQVPHIDTRELGLYLALNLTPQKLTEKGLAPFCPKRKKARGRPTITGCAMDEKVENRYMPWNDPENLEPDEETRKKMLSEAIKIGVSFTMSNHVYRFNRKIRIQSKGGPFGLALTGDVAQVFMMWWDRELKGRLEKIGMTTKLYGRYVDDIPMAPRKIETTPREEGDIKEDEENMKIIQEEANKIHKSIQVTYDCPRYIETGNYCP